MKEKIKKIFQKINQGLKIAGDFVIKYVTKFDKYIFLIAISAIAIFLRILVFKRTSQDINGFLKPWYIEILKDPKIVGTQLGDYTPAYIYFLWFISLFKIDVDSLGFIYFIKTFSIIFDFGIAIFSGLIVYHIDKSKFKATLTYGISLMCVTMFLNSSWWGQCDSIFSFFCIASIYFLLRGNNRTSMILYGVAFSFKLQAIFILPVFLILSFKNKIKFRYFLWIWVVYTLFALPSCFVSDNFFIRLKEIYKVYFDQATNSYKHLTLNCGTFYSIIFKNFAEESEISAFSVPLAFGIIGTYMVTILHSKKELDKREIFNIFALFSIIVPFFLPHMHDRYYYLADSLMVIFAMLNLKRFYVALLELTNSMIGYMAYLWNIGFFDTPSSSTNQGFDDSKSFSFRIGAILCLIAICLISVDIYKKLYSENKELNLRA